MKGKLEDLILKEASEYEQLHGVKIKGIKIFDGWYRWFLNDNSYSKIYDATVFDDIVQIERSIDDIKKIVELRLKLKEMTLLYVHS